MSAARRKGTRGETAVVEFLRASGSTFAVLLAEPDVTCGGFGATMRR